MLTGMVRFSCEGGFPERFLNEAAARDITLWRVRRDDIMLYASCRASAYRQLRSAAKAASVRMRVCDRRGLPFLLRPLRNRPGIPIGIVLFCLLLSGFSSRIWMLHVDGNTQLPEETILQVVRSLGVYEGGNFKNVDIPFLQLTALEKLPTLSWLAVNMRGCIAYVEVRERTAATPIADTSPANVVAAHDGVIVQIDAVCGQANVKVGDAVTKGSLLISGVMDSKVGPLLKHAAGVVKARTVHTVTITVPFEETVPDPASRTILRPEVYLFGFRIPLYTSGIIEGDYTFSTARYPVRAYGCPLPLGVTVSRYVFEDTVFQIYTPEEAKYEAHRRLEEAIGKWEGRTVESQTIAERQLPEAWEVCGTYTCLEDIGVVKVLEMHDKTM